MSQTELHNQEAWGSFPKQTQSFFTQDFAYGNPANFKIKTKSPRSSFHSNVFIRPQKDSIALSDQYKFWLTLPNNANFFAKVKSSNYLKLHIDNGVVNRWGTEWSLYGSLNMNKSWQNSSLRFGVHSVSSSIQSDNRIKIELLDNHSALTWYNRTHYVCNNWRLGSTHSYGISNRTFLQNTLLLGYKKDQLDFFAQVNSKHPKTSLTELFTSPQTWFENLSFGLVGSYKDNIKYGIQALFENKRFKQAIFAFQHEDKVKNRQAKIKMSTDYSLAVNYKFPSKYFKNIANTSIGAKISKLNAKDKTVAIESGISVQFNI